LSPHIQRSNFSLIIIVDNAVFSIFESALTLCFSGKINQYIEWFISGNKQ